MPNSADKSAELEKQESEVIELSDETEDSSQAPVSDPDLDDLGLAIPEFRVPTRTSPKVQATPDDDFEIENTDSIEPSEFERELETDLRTTDPDATQPPRDETDDRPAAARARGGPVEQGFDRAELVKTVRMDAFDRASVESGKASLEVDGYLDDQRYAPDVLILPPRVLTKKWQDGPATPANGISAEANNRADLATTVKTVKSATTVPAEAPTEERSALGEQLNESETEAIDIDEDAIEVQDVVKPPPKPQVQQPGEQQADAQPGGERPPEQAPPQEPAKQRPGRVRRNTGPLRPPEATAVPQSESEDDDLSGIVQELLDEKKAKPVQKAKKRPDDKRHNWFNDVFGEEYFRTLPTDLQSQTERDVKFIHKSLGLQKGARILDLACGFGRHAVELARRGYEVAGLDLSMAMLQRALSEAQRRSLSIKFIHGDMRELNFNGIFDACYCWQTSFGYFDDRTNVQVAQGVARALKPGGRFLLDLVNRDYVIQEMPSRTWWEGHECVFLEEVEFDNNFSVLHTKRSFIYEDGSPPREFSSFIRLYSLHELRQLLHFSGFRLREVSGAVYHQGSFLGPSSPRLIVLAEKVVKE